jgi:hypothetical protein
VGLGSFRKSKVSAQKDHGAIGEVDRTTRPDRQVPSVKVRPPISIAMAVPGIAIASAWAVNTEAAKTLESSTTRPVFGPSA